MPERRHKRGSGTFFQRRSDGLWVVRVPLGVGLSGKTEFIREYHPDEASAAAAHARLLAARDAGELTTTPQSWTVADLLTYHLDSKRGIVRPQSFTRYEARARLHILPALGDVALTDLTTLHVEGWLRGLARKKHARGDGLGAESVKAIRSILSAALEHAIDLGLIQRNPALRARLPALKQPAEPVPYTADETRAFLAAAEGTPLHAYWLAAALLGLRRGELSGLTWPAIDLADRELRITHQLQVVNGELLLLDYAKTKRSERPLPLPGTLVEALTARWQQQQDERRASGRQWGGGGWADKRLVFTTRHGQPFHPGTIDRRFATLARKAGVPIRTPHALRHANATRMLEAGVSTAVVQRILGHAHEKMSRHYQHVDLAMERAAVEAVEKALRGPSERQERASGEPQ